MKQFVTVLAAVMLLSISAFAADYVKVGNVNDDISVIVRESNDSRIVVDYQIGGFTQEGVQINGETYYQIQCGEENEPLIAGVPALPRICRSIIIPDNGEMRVNIISSEYVDYPATPVIPSKGPISRTINKADVPYEFGDVYNNSEFYPSNVAELREPFIIRDFRGTVIEFNGFQYNPDTRTLRVYKSVTIEVVNTGLAGANELQRTEALNSVVPDFDLIYKSRFINYPETMTTYTLVPETGEMLIITYDSYYNNMLPFAEWKNQKGIKTTMVNVSSIGNNESS
ncbi:MAG: hypothetical protein GY855_00100, partial [candidate division Zixibacteria bacterium]|nr:hypothetical protein [candidate division Zixibacteria bacterium]